MIDRIVQNRLVECLRKKLLLNGRGGHYISWILLPFMSLTTLAKPPESNCKRSSSLRKSIGNSVEQLLRLLLLQFCHKHCFFHRFARFLQRVCRAGRRYIYRCGAPPLLQLKAAARHNLTFFKAFFLLHLLQRYFIQHMHW